MRGLFSSSWKETFPAGSEDSDFFVKEDCSRGISFVGTVISCLQYGHSTFIPLDSSSQVIDSPQAGHFTLKLAMIHSPVVFAVSVCSGVHPKKEVHPVLYFPRMPTTAPQTNTSRRCTIYDYGTTRLSCLCGRKIQGGSLQGSPSLCAFFHLRFFTVPRPAPFRL